MKIVNTGNIYHLYDDSLKTFDQLPAQAYRVGFSKQTGFFLENVSNIEVKEKIYGVHMNKVEKVFKSFEMFERNMGVILSGAKGIGKSLFAKLLSIKAIEHGYPLIIVDAAYPGIANFISDINQEVIVMFDEFDKTFRSSKDGDWDPQSDMLTLFDGFSMGKKCFVVTCNELRNLSDFLVNRPGRFHYHFRFGYPQGDEIREYLCDKLQPEYHDEIEKVVAFATRVDLNYDCLRAIAFELNLGTSFADAIKDLNIVNTEYERHNLTIVFKDGKKSRTSTSSIDLFSDEEYRDSVYNPIEFGFSFIPSDAMYNSFTGGITIFGSDVKITYVDRDYLEEGETPESWIAKNPIDYILIKKQRAKEIHYAV